MEYTYRTNKYKHMTKYKRPTRLKGMTPAQETHLKFIKDSFCSLVDPKYRKGQKEHGGCLWHKRNLIDLALEEAIDQVVYLLTLKQQLYSNNNGNNNGD